MTDRCPTCMRPARAPYRRLHRGKISEGCVDAYHTGHLEPGSPDAAWHERPEAEACRAMLRAFVPDRTM